jgi:hypothetical protein
MIRQIIALGGIALAFIGFVMLMVAPLRMLCEDNSSMGSLNIFGAGGILLLSGFSLFMAGIST